MSTTHRSRDTRQRRSFGAVRKLPSGRFQASYVGPDGLRHVAPYTFDARTDADGWLATVRADILRDAWLPPEPAEPDPGPTLREYAARWLSERDIRPGTARLYEHHLRTRVLPVLGDTLLTDITPAMVRTWHAGLDAGTPTARAHAYALLRTILRTAVDDALIPASPCRIRAAGRSRRAGQTRPASIAELTAIAEAMPPRYRAAVLVSAWCALRFGEMAALRRSDLDLAEGVIHVRRGVVRVGGQQIEGPPKTDSSVRDVSIPPHVVPVLRDHVARHAGKGRDGLVFPASGGGFLSPSALYSVYYPAREKADRPDLRWHDLRHTGAVLAAATGATLKELMSRLGHSTPDAALVYQSAAADRDRAIADALSEMAGANVVPLRPRKAAG